MYIYIERERERGEHRWPYLFGRRLFVEDIPSHSAISIGSGVVIILWLSPGEEVEPLVVEGGAHQCRIVHRALVAAAACSGFSEFASWFISIVLMIPSPLPHLPLFSSSSLPPDTALS